MFAGHDQFIHDLLRAQALVPPATLDKAWESRGAAGGGSLAATLLEEGSLAAGDLLRAVAENLGLQVWAKLPPLLPTELLARVPPTIARHFQIIPVATSGNSLLVAAAEPLGRAGGEEFAYALGCPVEVVLADPREVPLLLERHYPAHAVDAVVTKQAEPSAEDMQQLAGQGPVIQLVNAVLAQAIRDRASDIHFEPFENEFKVRCRIDGTLHEIPSPPRALALPVISRLKVLANLNIAERRLPQDGRIQLQHGGKAVDLRVSTLPTADGESVVLRVLDQSSVLLDLAQLGLPDEMRRALRAAIHRPNGMVIVTGPTGSGKTTTLYSCLKELNAPGVKLLTVEDPVEYEIEGVMQVPVNPAAGLDFARALRSFMRQDPDVVMVGEIRDPETAQIAIQASLTGHLVLATLHTNDAASAVTRLADMGIEPYLLASSLEVVLAQRLLRKLCHVCRQPYRPDPEIIRQLDAEALVSDGQCFYQAKGCPECHHTGYQGRLGIFEFLAINDQHRELMTSGASVQDLREAGRANGVVSLRRAGLIELFEGRTTVEEILQHT